MQHSNHIVTDAANKRNDVIFFIRTSFFNNNMTKEEKLLKLIEVKTSNYKQLVNLFNDLPDNFKHLNDKNLGTA